MTLPARKNPLRIPVEEIPDLGEQVVVDQSVAPFAALLGEASETGEAPSGSADVKLERSPKRVDVEGILAATLGLTCVRCLQPYRQDVERRIFQILLREAQPDSDEEVELHDDDLDRSEIVDDVVDLEGLLREEIHLALPLKPLCDDGCKGICAGCGAELNHEECTCEPEIDPRWNALKGLKLPSK